MKLLHLDSSALGANSVTRELSAAIVARWQDAVPGLTVDYRDLDTNPLPHLTGSVLAGADAGAKADGDAAMAIPPSPYVSMIAESPVSRLASAARKPGK